MKRCLTCEKEFEPRKVIQRWCSKPCVKKGIPRPLEVRDKISKSHLGIKPNAETRVKMSLAKKGKPNLKNIGRKHTEEAKLKNSIAHRGSSGSGWRGGLTTLIRQVRRGLRYRTWRNSVYERDDFECQWCGNGDVYFNADHIIPFSFLLRANNIKTLEEAEKCEALWDIRNGRTLCVPCHKKTDTYLNKGKVYIKNVFNS